MMKNNTPEEKETLGERLTKLIEVNDTNRDDLAKYLGINKSSLSRYCNDVRFPPEDTMIKLAEFFNCTIDYLYGRSSNPNHSVVYVENNYAVEIKGKKREIDERALQILINKLESVGINTEILIKKDTDI